MPRQTNLSCRKSSTPKNKPIPKLRHHKATDQGYIVLNRKVIYLGKYGLPETTEKYHQAMAEWLACGQQLPADPNQLSIKELIARYWVHAQKYYRKANGIPTTELDNMRQVLRPLRELYASLPAAEFGPRCLKTLRQNMIDKGWCRNHINKSISRIKTIFRWATGEELIPGNVHHALMAVGGLKRGRGEVRESNPVKPVPQEWVEAIEPFVSPQIWALIHLQLLTGARPGELVIMRPGDIDTSGPIWIYQPAEHKTAHHGHNRNIYIGPRGQEVLQPYLQRAPQAYCFSPAEAEARRRMKQHQQRLTPLSSGNRPGTNRKPIPIIAANDCYTVDSYRRAIARACDHACPPPPPLAKENYETTPQWQQRIKREKLTAQLHAWQKEHRWHPHQLRHNAATFLRKEFGLEIARVILGHRSTAVTEVYAELDHGKALNVVAKIG